jgi:hypothetical protein
MVGVHLSQVTTSRQNAVFAPTLAKHSSIIAVNIFLTPFGMAGVTGGQHGIGQSSQREGYVRLSDRRETRGEEAWTRRQGFPAV